MYLELLLLVDLLLLLLLLDVEARDLAEWLTDKLSVIESSYEAVRTSELCLLEYGILARTKAATEQVRASASATFN